MRFLIVFMRVTRDIDVILAFLIGQPLNFTENLEKTYQIMPKILPAYYAGIMPYAFQSLLC